ncbi:MAG: AraC family ligand binding domain-containing protein, partial [Lautropia sp.]
MTRSIDPLDYQTVPRPIAAMAKRFRDGHRIQPHRHARAQFIYAVTGTMSISTDRGTWLVPPDRALWMPAGEQHAIDIAGTVDMRTLYIDIEASAHLNQKCRVVGVNSLLRALIVRATELPVLYDEQGPAAAVMQLILAEIATAPALPLHLPMPRDRRLLKLCQLLQ